MTFAIRSAELKPIVGVRRAGDEQQQRKDPATRRRKTPGSDTNDESQTI